MFLFEKIYLSSSLNFTLEDYIGILSKYLIELIEKYPKIREKIIKGKAPIESMTKISNEIKYAVMSLEDYINIFLEDNYGIPQRISISDILLYLITEYFADPESNKDVGNRLREFLGNIRTTLKKRDQSLANAVLAFAKKYEKIPTYLYTESGKSLWDTIKEKLKGILAFIITAILPLIASPELILTILTNITIELSIKVAYIIFTVFILIVVLYGLLESIYVSLKYKENYEYLIFVKKLRKPRKNKQKK